ncbi:MAG: putative peptidoglycan glycosyltransferase FtsW, partial [Candidatus Omnitrophota bacterium]
GAQAGGARRWFKFLGFSFQPSELLKIGLIFYMADFLDRHRQSLRQFKRTVLPALGILGVAIGLVFKQPDFGTAITISAVVFIMFFVSGFNVLHLAGLFLMALPPLYYAMMSKPYRRKRLLAFFHPWEDPRGVGFQIIQSFLALGCGGLFGVGLGRSQQKLFYLPESHTDFIFSIIGEELGFVGAVSIVILFVVFIFAGMVIAYRCRTFFSQLMTIGLVSLVGFEAAINIGVSIGALPTKGLSLPFISYGGSALLANLVVLGLLMNISRTAVVE